MPADRLKSTPDNSAGSTQTTLAPKLVRERNGRYLQENPIRIQGISFTLVATPIQNGNYILEMNALVTGAEVGQARRTMDLFTLVAGGTDYNAVNLYGVNGIGQDETTAAHISFRSPQETRRGKDDHQYVELHESDLQNVRVIVTS